MFSKQLQGLRVKSYFASSFEEAMKQAQRDMGQDALLLNSRETPAEARHLGAWEVVFGATGPEVNETPAPPPPPQATHVQQMQLPAASIAPVAPVVEDDLQRHLDQIQTLLKRLTTAQQAAQQPAAQAAPNPVIGQALIDAGLERTLAMEIEESVRSRFGKAPGKTPFRGDPESIMLETARDIADRFTVKPELGNVTALVGPPGSGKTTTLIKLAISQGLQKRRPVRIITMDTRKIGAVEQMERYAAILDATFQAVETAAELEHAIQSATLNSLTLVDTPGFSNACLTSSAGELAEFLTRRQDIDTHLVLTASMRSEDVKRTADRFEIFHPAKLLFTKIDETDSLAAVFREAATRQRPLSFFTDGIVIPENLQPATKERVITALVRHLPDGLRRVA